MDILFQCLEGIGDTLGFGSTQAGMSVFGYLGLPVSKFFPLWSWMGCHCFGGTWCAVWCSLALMALMEEQVAAVAKRAFAHLWFIHQLPIPGPEGSVHCHS